jgi:flavin reductase (DIM6/NTAB) family NADH-FMN oxidoreductase RutF
MSFSSQDFRKAMSHFTTGVAILTTCDSEGQPHGMTINSLTSASLDPPLLLFCLNKYSKTAHYFTEAPCFAVNILSGDQESLARTFAARDLKGWDGLERIVSSLGNPILKGVVAALECKPRDIHAAGDHHILIAEVHQLNIFSTESPLVFFKSHFHSLKA